MIANGGRRVKPTLIDRIQDRYGHTIFKHDQRECRGCDAPDGWKNQPEPQLVDRREQVLDSDDRLPDHRADGGRGPGAAPATVDARKSASRSPARPVRPTRPRTLWFVGFSPDLAVGLYVGYDKPRPLGRNAATGGTSGGADRARLHEAGAGRQARRSVRVPAGIKLIRVDVQDRHALRSGRWRAARSSKRSSRAPRRRITTRSSVLPTPTEACRRQRCRPVRLLSIASGDAAAFTEGS